MSAMTDTNQPTAELDKLTDNEVTVFQLDGQPVRGRAVHLGKALDDALTGPKGEARYPDEIARLLGEAMLLGALVT